ALAAMILLGGNPPARAQKSDSLQGTVRPTEFSPNPIAVPPFQGQGETGKADPFSETIQRDLVLSGFFRAPSNAQFVAETHAFDLKEDKIHYADWFRLGVSYVVKGKYSIAGDQLEVEFRTYDTTMGTYIFGKRYDKYPKNNARQLAHRISNDIIKRITNVDGVAHTQLVFVGEVPGKGTQTNKEIFVIDEDGENRKQLTNDKNLDATPTWGARGTEIYYTTYKDYNPDLAGIYLDGSYNWFVSRRAGFNLSPAWSEKKQLIALTLSKDGNSEIYTMTRAGKDLKRLTYGKSIDSSPVWSPNGDYIAFTSDRNGGPQIYIMDESGVNVRQLTHSGSYNDGAAWSPKGDMIAFSSRIDGIFQIFTINVNGGDLRPLTSGNYNSEDPTWSPNGWVIAYTSDRTGTKQINLMFLDGRQLGQITNGTAGSYSANWSPLFP
ncbi:PD40 domain-containing protein, partial [Candidatus Sumerlaeota bacterium]|nr:PD40 domain-containing protein [Candidatus Sumerlaeota bacterium]